MRVILSIICIQLTGMLVMTVTVTVLSVEWCGGIFLWFSLQLKPPIQMLGPGSLVIILDQSRNGFSILYLYQR